VALGSIALVSGSLPPEVCGVGDYTSRLYAELRQKIHVDLLHIPICRPYERSLFGVFRDRRIVHVQYPTEGWGNSLLPTFLPLAKRSGSKLVLTLHEWSRMNRVRRTSILPLVALSDGLVFVSESERKAFLQTAPLRARARPTWVVPIGVNVSVPSVPEEAVREQRAHELQDGRYDLLLSHFGFIHADKQPEILLATVEEMVRRRRRPKLMFVGDFQKDKLKERAAFLRRIEELGGAVEMKGFVADEEVAAKIMGASDAIVALFADGLTPRRGSFWYAGQHGRPVITTEPACPLEMEHLGAPQVSFVRRDVSANELADLLVALPPYRVRELDPVPVPSWRDIAARHVDVYEELLGRGIGSRSISLV
jgi:glycosyltransferase involved in cell wall biosynthesis